MTGPAPRVPAPSGAVARVAVEVGLAHLDRPFDYLVPAALDAQARAGCRVRVRFAGRLVNGFLLDRRDRSEHEGRLAYLDRVIGTEAVLSPQIATLIRAVADRYAGSFADVARLAVPPRHARAEAAASTADTASGPAAVATHPPSLAAAAVMSYPGGAELLAALAGGQSPRVVWTLLPGPGWATEVAALATATLASGRGVIVVAPDGARAERLRTALAAQPVVALGAEMGPAPRYRAFLAALHGRATVVVGTRAAAFAPLPKLGLIVVLDDGSDAHRDPHAPYPHMRDVALLRAHQQGVGLVLASHARSVEAQHLLDTGWADELRPDRSVLRARAPRVEVAGGEDELALDPAARAARLPSLVWRTVKAAAVHGPVLIQVPRAGYQPALACARCRAGARCAHCTGPLARATRTAPPSCRWCGRPAADWTCPQCDNEALRAPVVGTERTAEELGRAFPGLPVRSVHAGDALATVTDRPQLVVATPGSEPAVDGVGYQAVVLLDGWLLLARPDLRAAEEALRRWANAAALAGPAAPVVVCAPAGAPAVQALVRWDPGGLAEREAAERSELHFPPAARLAALSGPAAVLTDVAGELDLPPGGELLGPVAVPGAGPGGQPESRLLVRVPRRFGGELAAALHTVQAARSARKAGPGLRVELDPDLGA